MAHPLDGMKQALIWSKNRHHMLIEQALPTWPLLRATLSSMILADAHSEASSAYRVPGKARLGPP